MKKILQVAVILAFAVLLVSLTVFPLEDSDIWFHLKGGEWIWQNRKLPCPDPFSWPLKDLCWNANEWGIEVILYGIKSMWGLDGIIVAKSILIITTFLLLLIGQIRLTGFSLWGVTILTAGVIASADRFMERVEHVAYFLAVILLGLLFWWRRLLLIYPTGRRVMKHYRVKVYLPLLLIPVIFFLWGNLHPSAALGMVLLGLLIVGEGVVSIVKSQKSKIKSYRRKLKVKNTLRLLTATLDFGLWTLNSFKKNIDPVALPQKAFLLLGLAAAFALTAAINPYGFRPVIGVFKGASETAQDVYAATLIEWQSPFAPAHRQMVYTQAFLVTLFLYWATMVVGWFKNGIRPYLALILVAISYLGLSRVRHINVFVLVGYLPVMMSLSPAGLKVQSPKPKLKSYSSKFKMIWNFIRRRRRLSADSLGIAKQKLRFSRGINWGLSNSFITLLYIAYITIYIGSSWYIYKNGYQLGRVYRTFSLGKRPIFAQDALNFLDEHNINGNLFNGYGLGGYVIYAGYPKRKVFMDGRAHYPPALYLEHSSVNESAEKAQTVMDKYQIDYVIILHPETGESGLADYLSDDKKNWALIYWDQYYLVYVRREPFQCRLKEGKETAEASDEDVKPAKTPGMVERATALDSSNGGTTGTESVSLSESTLISPESLQIGNKSVEISSETEIDVTDTKIKIDCGNWHNVISKYEYAYADPILLGRPEALERLSRSGKKALKPKVRTRGELERNLEINPDNNRARLLLGGILELIPDPDEAKKVYEDIVRRDPKFPMGHFSLGNILLKQAKAAGQPQVSLFGPKEDARKDAESEAEERGAESGKDTWDAALKRSRRDSTQGEKVESLTLANGQKVDKSLWEKAKQEFKKAFGLDKSVSRPLVVLGEMEKEEDNLDQAEELWLKATRINPTDSEAFYYLGVLYSNERFDREKARYHLERYLALTSGDTAERRRAETILQRLKRQ